MQRGGRGVVVAVLAALTWRFAKTPLDPGVMDAFLHLPNLVFHEAGHFILMPFGRFMSVLGGSLLQLLVPLVCAGAFLWQHANQFGAAVCIWWAGQNLVDLAPYIADARALQLPLLGGATGAEVEGHDWEYLLEAIGWLHLDKTLGRAAHYAGSLVMAAALVWAITLVLRADDAAASHARTSHTGL
jgi:hypothetical protein